MSGGQDLTRDLRQQEPGLNGRQAIAASNRKVTQKGKGGQYLRAIWVALLALAAQVAP